MDGLLDCFCGCFNLKACGVLLTMAVLALWTLG